MSVNYLALTWAIREVVYLAMCPNRMYHHMFPKGLIIDSLAALSGVTDAVFMPWIEDRINLIWLESNDDRLGMTRFEEGPGELNRRRLLRLDPGTVTIGLHPALLEDEMLYKHTFVHEFLHASGLTLHSPQHDESD